MCKIPSQCYGCHKDFGTKKNDCFPLANHRDMYKFDVYIYVHMMYIYTHQIHTCLWGNKGTRLNIICPTLVCTYDLDLDI